MDLTLAEIEEALTHATSVPIEQRGDLWQKYLDSLLDKRNKIAATEAQRRHTRIQYSGEQRT